MGRLLEWARGSRVEPPAPPQLPAEERSSWTPAEDRIGICCSGGGIRSGAFNLGALQRLQHSGILRRASYVAAVSGGSYIAAAFSIVQKHSDANGYEADFRAKGREPYAWGSPEERWLRNNSSYLAPRLRGKARLVSHLLLGLTLNVLLIGALLTLIAVPLGLLGSYLRPGLLDGGQPLPLPPAEEVWWLSWRTGLLFGLALAGLACALAAAGTRLGDKPGSLAMRLAKGFCAAAAVMALAVGLPAAVAALRDAVAATIGSNTPSQTPASDTNWLLTIVSALGVPPLAAGVIRSFVEKHGAAATGRLRALATPRLATAIAGPVLLVSVFLLLYNLAASRGWRGDVAALWLGALAVLVVLYLVLDPVASSLYTFYKRRLCTAFAVERVAPDRARERPYETLVKLSDSRVEGWPTLLVCAAANISDEGLTPPGRNAVPFVFSHDWIGGDEVGYIQTEAFEDALGPKRQRDVTLPAAVAMSGAAVSPSMGKMTSRAHTFLLALANARLGVWLPNPRYVAEGRAGRRANWPRPGMTWLLREMRGLNRSTAKYLYVSDGGHYENLGLLELLRRGCTTIYCFDASGDEPGSFTTLGQAMALARTELDVDIPIDPEGLRPADPDSLGERAHVVVPFAYPDGTEGTLLYAKAMLTRDAPWDVRAYRTRDPEFPNNTTADQLYTDERFEAYRALGDWLAQRLLADPEAPPQLWTEQAQQVTVR